MDINFNLPLNSVSFGQVSVALLRAAFAASSGIRPSIFPLGNVDVSAQPISKPFVEWLEGSINNAAVSYDRNNPCIKLWHINGAVDSVGREQSLFTFHETDQLTPIEINILKQQKNVFVTSNFTKEVFNEHGLNNVSFVDLGFDKDNFYTTVKRTDPEVITFGLFGKLEFRKAHEKVIRNWVAKFGNDRRYRLVAAVWNPHFQKEHMIQQLNNIFQGKRYWNVTVLENVKTNAEYNDIINNIDIVIGCSRAEGRDLPVFHAVGLGKHCVGLNAHAYKDYLNADNAVLINPTSMVPAVDNIFFHRGAPFNQGNFFDWNDEEFISACETAIVRYTRDKVNQFGLLLQQKTYQNTLNQVLEKV